VEGRTEECTVRRLLGEYGAAGPIATSWLSSPAGGGLDFICSADRQLLNQVKAVKYLHRQLRNYHRAYGSAIATPLTSWQIETEPTAGEIMTPLMSLTTLAPGTTVHHAIGQMLQSGADALLVCDEGHQVQGVVTLTDLARCIHDSRGVLTIARIETVMQSPVAVELTASFSEVRSLIADSGPTLIAVTSPTGATVGGITFQEVLAHEQSGRNTYRPERTQNSRYVLLQRPTGVCVPV
jgi:CBS domain-containing protein